MRERALHARMQERPSAARWMPAMMGTAAATGTAAMVAANGVGALAPTPFSFAGIAGGFGGGIGLLGALLVLVILVLVVLVLIDDDCGRPA